MPIEMKEEIKSFYIKKKQSKNEENYRYQRNSYSITWHKLGG